MVSVINYAIVLLLSISTKHFFYTCLNFEESLEHDPCKNLNIWQYWPALNAVDVYTFPSVNLHVEKIIYRPKNSIL